MTDSFEDFCWKDIVSPQDLEIYGHYRRPLYVGKNAAVLAIDIYNLVFKGGNRPVHEVAREVPSSCGENAWRALAPTQKLYAAARAAGIPIIHLTRYVDTGDIHSTHRQREELSNDDYAFKAELAPMPGELVIYKERASAFFGTALIARLRALGVESLIICGESTSGCVRASTVDAFSYGFHNTLVEECTFDRSMLIHKVNLFDMHHKYADVMHVDDVVAHLAGLVKQRSVA